MERLIDPDLDLILAQTGEIWRDLRGARIFITGGTGFYGAWLLETLIAANEKFSLGVRAEILTRDENAFRLKCPHLAASSVISFRKGDVRDFDFLKTGFTHIIHAATEASAKLNSENPALMREVIVKGTHRTLEFAKKCGASRFLLTSSGAVYGRQRPEVTHISEDDEGLLYPVVPPSAYAEGKREAERLCREAQGRQFQVSITRGFAFVGPYLPLDIHFAIGNFIRDALEGNAIMIQGDGTPYRSYLYGLDLAIWLWTVLLRGQDGRAYNVGSENAISILDLARAVAKTINPQIAVHLARNPEPGKIPERYVPMTRRAREELGLKETVSLEEAIRRTAEWAQMVGILKRAV